MIASLIFGIVLLIIGSILKFFGVQRNSLFGYRTFRSMKSEAHWTYANKAFATHALIIGVIALAASLSTLVFSSINRYLVIFLLSPLLISIIIIEIRLKKFDKTHNNIKS